MNSIDQTTLDKFLRTLCIVSPAKQKKMIEAGMQVLSDKPEEALCYKASQAAKLLNISYQTFWRLCREGKIKPVILHGRLKRYSRKELERITCNNV